MSISEALIAVLEWPPSSRRYATTSETCHMFTQSCRHTVGPCTYLAQPNDRCGYGSENRPREDRLRSRGRNPLRVQLVEIPSHLVKGHAAPLTPGNSRITPSNVDILL